MEKVEKPVNMYILFARLFYHLTKEAEEAFGEAGVEAMRRGVWNFGVERGKDIARRAAAKGCPNDIEHYLSCYDMERSEHFKSEDTIKDGEIEEIFTECVFAHTFSEDGMEKYGIHYCEIVDPAIAYGYNSALRCQHDKHFFKDGQCHFCFRMQEPRDEETARDKAVHGTIGKEG